MGEAEQIRVLLVEPEKRPRLVSIPHTLENLQKLVGGNIEAVYPWDDPVAVVGDGEAKLKQKKPNRVLEDYDILCGTFFICGLEEDRFASLSDELAEKYQQKFLYPEVFARREDGRIVCFIVAADGEK